MIEELLKKASLKNTSQRYKVLSIIESSKEPLTAEEIYKQLVLDDSKINLSTVYRTLNVFASKNLLLKILRTDGTAAYELNENAHKHYITCSECNCSVLIEDCPIRDLSEKVNEKTGFKVTGHSLQLTGICSECRKNKKED